MTARAKREKIAAQIAAAQGEAEGLIADIARLEGEIVAAAVKDEGRAALLIENKSACARSLELNRYKLQSLDLERNALRAACLREDLADARKVFEEKQAASKSAATRREAAQKELDAASRELAACMSHELNAGGALSRIEQDLAQIEKDR